MKHWVLGACLLLAAGCGSREVTIVDEPLPADAAAERDAAQQQFGALQRQLESQRRQQLQRMAPPELRIQPPRTDSDEQ